MKVTDEFLEYTTMGADLSHSMEKYESKTTISSANPVMLNLLHYHTRLTGIQAHHLQRLVSQWQLIADLSFADLNLWVPSVQIPHALVCLAQCRPNTAVSVRLSDQIGHVMPAEGHIYQAAISAGRIISDPVTQWIGTVGIRSEAIPVRYEKQPIGVIARQTSVSAVRLPSALEIAYRDSGGDLVHMITAGNFPTEHSESINSDYIRAGDGFVRLDAHGGVVFISHHAISAYRNLGYAGSFENKNLMDITSSVLLDRFEAEEIQRLFRGVFDYNREFRREIESSGTNLSLRAIPLIPRGQQSGAIVLVKDLTEMKREDRALLSKDAIIREIHHRVKNNLQSVSALLRLQSRRSGNAETQKYLDEAVRRISAISTVHDTLSLSVDETADFDEILSLLIPTIADIGASDEKEIRISFTGQIGVVSSQIAMPLAMIFTEIVQNSMEHAFVNQTQGTIMIDCHKDEDKLTMIIRDDGSGLPEDFALSQSKTLGLYIVSTLTSTELQGVFSLSSNKPKGTEIKISVPLNK